MASKPVAPRSHRLALVACVLAVAVGIGYVVARLTLPAPSTPATQASRSGSTPSVAPHVVAKPLAASTHVATRKHVERRKADVPPPPVVPSEPVEPVIYKSADMSDAEFAAWKRRKAERELGGVAQGDQIPPPDPAYVDGPHDGGVSPQTMQAILRSNRR